MDTAQRRKQARTLLTHYLTLIADKAGVPLHGDCYKEIGDITDLIFDEIAERTATAKRTAGPNWDDPKYSKLGHKDRLFKCAQDDRSTDPKWGAGC